MFFVCHCSCFTTCFSQLSAVGNLKHTSWKYIKKVKKEYTVPIETCLAFLEVLQTCMNKEWVHTFYHGRNERICWKLMNTVPSF